MRLTEPYEGERNIRNTLRTFSRKSPDHMAAVKSVELRSATIHAGRRIMIGTAATSAALIALFRENMPEPLTVAAAVAAIASSAAVGMHGLLSLIVRSRLHDLHAEHPYRFRQIFAEIRTRVPAIRKTVDAIEAEITKSDITEDPTC